MTANPHPLLERQWSLDEFTLLKAFFGPLGAGLSLLAMVFFGGYAFIVGGVAGLLLLAGGVLMGLARTDHALTLAIRFMVAGAILGFGPGFYLVP